MLIRRIFPLKNNPKNLDPSYKINLDFGTVLEMKKAIS